MKLHIYKELPVRIPVKKINALFMEISTDISKSNYKSNVNLIFTTDEKIKKLNYDYRNKKKVTDVLSFNLDKLDEMDGVFGEIYISVPQVKLQAGEYGVLLWDEILRLVCHGILHLFGYDHNILKDEKIMQNKEKAYLSNL